MATDGEQHNVPGERIVDVHERFAIARIDEVSLEMLFQYFTKKNIFFLIKNILM